MPRKSRKREKGVAKKTSNKNTSENQDLGKAFWTGFFWPVRYLLQALKYVGKVFAWVSHKPPLKQIGHGLRWFFRLRAIQFIGRMLGFGYFKSSWKELKQVTWPTRHESFRLTGAVLIFSVAFGLFIALVDYGLDKLFRQILLN